MSSMIVQLIFKTPAVYNPTGIMSHVLAIIYNVYRPGPTQTLNSKSTKIIIHLISEGVVLIIKD